MRIFLGLESHKSFDSTARQDYNGHLPADAFQNVREHSRSTYIPQKHPASARRRSTPEVLTNFCIKCHSYMVGNFGAKVESHVCNIKIFIPTSSASLPHRLW